MRNKSKGWSTEDIVLVAADTVLTTDDLRNPSSDLCAELNRDAGSVRLMSMRVHDVMTGRHPGLNATGRVEAVAILAKHDPDAIRRWARAIRAIRSAV
jgi:hypothetical protein